MRDINRRDLTIASDATRTPPVMDRTAEWLEADGLGGFASGTVGGVRTRRYHALLLVATEPPAGRVVLVNGLEVWVDTPTGTFALSSQRYVPDVVYPDGSQRIVAFTDDPWPRWTFSIAGGVRVEQEVVVRPGAAAVVLVWRLADSAPLVRLRVRPLLSGRDYHALHHENPVMRFDAEMTGGRVTWQPYPSLPAVTAQTNGAYVHQPEWYRQFLYVAERVRGLDDVEDLASPGTFHFDLSAGAATMVLAAAPAAPIDVEALRAAEGLRRHAFPSRLHRAADAYVVRRGTGRTIIAGYPWFTDWGRDTFIALRGLCLAGGRVDDARGILLEWAGAVSEGMLPNRFPDHGVQPEYNSVDAALWFVVAAHELLQQSTRLAASDRQTLQRAIVAILEGHVRGTRHGIRMDADGLLAAGEAGLQLTWMDAKVGDHVVTPRIGKPVEVQALWINALRIAGAFDARWQGFAERAASSFAARFWYEQGGHLHDVVDVEHLSGSVDPTFRPNQILSVGGLPWPVLDDERGRRVVIEVERRLWTPLGLRTLPVDAPGYRGHYAGGVAERDGAYHQGTAWPWLLGPFVEAWVRLVGSVEDARRRFLAPLLAHLDHAGLGHVSEIADGDPPHTPRGCPFQAWSLGEVMRLALAVLAERDGGRSAC
jgi:predicted glycogen debranching enzyme